MDGILAGVSVDITLHGTTSFLSISLTIHGLS